MPVVGSYRGLGAFSLADGRTPLAWVGQCARMSAITIVCDGTAHGSHNNGADMATADTSGSGYPATLQAFQSLWLPCAGSTDLTAMPPHASGYSDSLGAVRGASSAYSLSAHWTPEVQEPNS